MLVVHSESNVVPKSSGHNSEYAKELKAPQAAPPRHFHLLWDDDLEEMRDIFLALRDRRAEVVARWYQLYTLHFGDQRTLSEADFFQIFEPALFRNKNDLLEKNMDRYAQDVRSLGETLAERGVPLQEIIASLQLFEQAASEVFPPGASRQIDVYTKFDQLSHIRIILLVDAYFRIWSARHDARLLGLEREAALLPREQRTSFHGIISVAAPMRALFERIEAAGKTSGTVLVVGESGTGKELVARALHEVGPRRAAPFVAFNCAALPKDLIESELFGYRKGAFSGANSEYLGLFRAAEGGTLFLDEITEMSPETQTKLLRAIQERAVRPLGATRELPIDVRLVASTNRDPEEAVRAQILRQDLYYRLQATMLRLPPLRERIEDVPVLVEHFIALFNRQLGRGEPVEGIGQRALAALQRYSWPGNVRELSNAIESAMTFGKNRLIELEDLPPALSGNRSPAASATPALSNGAPDTTSPGMGTFAEAERNLISRALKACDWNKVHAAQMLRISRKKLYAKISKYGLQPAP
ncbi:MAG TPA: sigma-54 dependent transcriptional regulator [Candidatus Binataceae bacterium]|nr:sigma-54 dependent transcriptional regulator [Candidatus Binataceae bacterium]